MRYAGDVIASTDWLIVGVEAVVMVISQGVPSVQARAEAGGRASGRAGGPVQVWPANDCIMINRS